MAKLTASQKARAKAMSKRRGVKYPNAWSNLAVARGKTKKTKKANKQLLIAAASRIRAEITQNIEQEATKKAKK
mgnify:CR=1 FL=1